MMIKDGPMPPIRHARGTVLQVAVEKSQEGAAVLAVSAASAYHSGGGFLTGGRHALEEAMCIQSSLFTSLELAQNKALSARVTTPDWCQPAQRQSDGADWHAHIPEDGCVLPP